MVIIRPNNAMFWGTANVWSPKRGQMLTGFKVLSRHIATTNDIPNDCLYTKTTGNENNIYIAWNTDLLCNLTFSAIFGNLPFRYFSG